MTMSNGITINNPSNAYLGFFLKAGDVVLIPRDSNNTQEGTLTFVVQLPEKGSINVVVIDAEVRLLEWSSASTPSLTFSPKSESAMTP